MAIPPVHFAALRAADGLTIEAIAAELMREAAQREALYKTEVAKGRMTRAQAEYGVSIFQAMAADMECLAAARPPAPDPRFPWGERRDALGRELAFRARVYPEWIAKGRLTQDDAARRNAMLCAALDAYEGGWDMPTDDRARGTQIYLDFLLRRELATPDTLRAAYPDCSLPAEQQSLAV